MLVVEFTETCIVPSSLFSLGLCTVLCLEWLDLIFSVPKNIYPAIKTVLSRAEGKQHGVVFCECLMFFDGNIGKRKVAEVGVCELS